MTLAEAKEAYQNWIHWYNYALAHPAEVPAEALEKGKKQMVDALHTYTDMVQATAKTAALNVPGTETPKPSAPASNPFTDAIPNNIKMYIGIALAAAALYMIFTGKKK